MLKLVLVSCLVLAITAQHSHPTHPTHPTHATKPAHGGNHVAINDGFKFHFDDHTGNMIMATHTHCYIMMLTDAEKADLKDPMKVEALEIQMVTIVGGGDASKLTDVDAATAGHTVASHCHHLQIVQVAH